MMKLLRVYIDVKTEWCRPVLARELGGSGLGAPTHTYGKVDLCTLC